MAKPSRDERRPDPDALLAVARREGKGRLKIFLGAAPGVGKTFAMLQGAQRLRAEGMDVVVGLAETHGREETASLLDGLEILPRRDVTYHGRNLQEFDLDAALARRPKLLLLDELAHSNPVECRHPKRWQDVEELLDAGLDVWTTLNIQHVESLADVVARITGVTVRETIPDKMINEAEDVVLVDITPDELITRLNEGKIYVPETARRATQNFFTPGNLTALRELALRRTADRVDDQVSEYLRQRFLDGVAEPAKDPVVLPNCLDLAELPALVRRERLILFAGRVVADKAPDAFITACAAALPFLPGWRAEIIGADRFSYNSPDTGFVQMVRAAAEGANVRMLGYRDHPEVLAAMGRAAIVVVPSRWPEPFGLVALEALASGAALICSPRGGLPEVGGDVAIYANPDNPAEIAVAIRALAADETRRAALARAGRERVRQFDVGPIGAQLAEIRQRIIAAAG